MNTLKLVKSAEKDLSNLKAFTDNQQFILDSIRSINTTMYPGNVLRKLMRFALDISDSSKVFIWLETKKQVINLAYNDENKKMENRIDERVKNLLLTSITERKTLVDVIKFESHKRLENKKLAAFPLVKNENFTLVIGLLFNFYNPADLKFIEKNFELIKNQTEIALFNAVRFSERMEKSKAVEIEKNKLEKEHLKYESAEKLKYEFLAQISHEIRTPIHKILGFTSILKHHFKESFDKELINNCKVIDSGGKRLVRTIDLMLNMSQVKAGTIELDKEKFSLYDFVIRGLEKEFIKPANDAGLSFEIINNCSHDFINADVETVTQIFNNLIDNAIKYTNEGFVEVVLYNDENENVCVEVRDSGIGMSEEYQQKLFTPFTQEYTGYTRPYEGNGLALALIKEYCKMNNAEITVKSEKGVGTTIKVKFIN